MAEFKNIRLDIAEGIATITLDRPEKMNTATRATVAELCEAIDRTDADDAVRAVIFTGAGERAFCAGADLAPEDGQAPFADNAEVDDLSDERVRDWGGLLTLRLFQSTKPLIAA